MNLSKTKAISELRLRMMIIITDRNSGEKILSALGGLVHFNSIAMGRGTAKTEILATLGLDEPEKDIVITFVKKENVEKVYEILENKFRFSTSSKGIAMTVPINSVGGLATLKLLAGSIKNKEKKNG